jgi:hypothetical protein
MQTTRISTGVARVPNIPCAVTTVCDGKGSRYTAKDDAILVRAYQKYRTAGKTMQRCQKTVAAKLGRSEKAVNQRILRLRMMGELPLWDGSVQAHIWPGGDTVGEGSASDDSEDSGGDAASTPSASSSEHSSTEESLRHRESGADADRPDPFDRALARTIAPTRRPASRPDSASSLGKRSLLRSEASTADQMLWSPVSSSNSLQDPND